MTPIIGRVSGDASIAWPTILRFSRDGVAATAWVPVSICLPSSENECPQLGSARRVRARAANLNDLLQPSQSPSSLSHFFNDLFAVLFAAIGSLGAPGRHRVKNCVYRLARLIWNAINQHRIEVPGTPLFGLA